MKILRLTILTGLAWLGLAGLSDNIVEWQNWFEQGIMEHWRSVKVWVVAVLFSWLPFALPYWVLDYLVIGAIIAKPFANILSVERLSQVDPNKLPGGTNPLLDPPKDQYEIMVTNLAASFATHIVLPLIWPALIVFILSGFDRLKLTNTSREEKKSALLQIGLAFIGFVPVLFVASTLMYELG